MNYFDWWTGSNLQISIVLFMVFCALGTLVALALLGLNKKSEEEQLCDDEEQAKAIRRVPAKNYWEQA